jgi:hypothetical protein
MKANNDMFTVPFLNYPFKKYMLVHIADPCMKFNTQFNLKHIYEEYKRNNNIPSSIHKTSCVAFGNTSGKIIGADLHEYSLFLWFKNPQGPQRVTIFFDGTISVSTSRNHDNFEELIKFVCGWMKTCPESVSCMDSLNVKIEKTYLYAVEMRYKMKQETMDHLPALQIYGSCHNRDARCGKHALFDTTCDTTMVLSYISSFGSCVEFTVRSSCSKTLSDAMMTHHYMYHHVEQFGIYGILDQEKYGMGGKYDEMVPEILQIFE